MKIRCIALYALTLVSIALLASPAAGHFVVLLPSDDVVESVGGTERAAPKSLQLDLLFTHPMEQGPVMEMARPRQFGVVVDGQKQDLLPDLKPRTVQGKTAYRCDVPLKAPGDYLFFVEPAPYWEAAERKWIVHYTKVVVDVMGAESGWDASLGLPVEIEPLVRPFGLWTGNTFRGIVRREGKPVPFATVEVEYYNEGHKVKPPNDALITQVVKADASGVFAYTMPRAGWWGFAALVSDGPKRDGPDGKPAEVELGGLMWVKTVDMQAPAETRPLQPRP